MNYTETNKQLVVACLREFCKREKWRRLLESAADDPNAPKSFIDESTVTRVLRKDYDTRKMRDRTLDQIVWLLKYYNALDLHESMEESNRKFSLALKKFINPTPSSYQHLADALVGLYQGYRWSVSEPRTLVLFPVAVEFDSKNGVLLTKEIGYDPKTETQEINDGTMAINPDNQGIHYIISRKKTESVVMGLQLTMIHSLQNDIDGKVSEMSGIVFGQADNGPFFRNVLFHRHDSPEISCIRPNREKHAPIMDSLNKMQIDLPNHLGWFAEIKVK